MKLGPLLETQLSADTGEGTGGRKQKQRMIIEFYIYASTLCLHVSVCGVKLSVKDAIQIPTPALHGAQPRALNEMIIQTSGVRYKSLERHMSFSLITIAHLLQVLSMHHSIEMTLNICPLPVLSDNDDSHELGTFLNCGA